MLHGLCFQSVGINFIVLTSLRLFSSAQRRKKKFPLTCNPANL